MHHQLEVRSPLLSDWFVVAVVDNDGLKLWWMVAASSSGIKEKTDV